MAMAYGAYSPETISRIVGEIDFLGGLPTAEIQDFVLYATRLRTIEPRAYLFEQGSHVEHVYLVIEGQVLLLRNDRNLEGQRIQRLRMIVEPGKMAGHYDFLYHQAHSTQARALETTQVLEIDAHLLYELMRKYPSIRAKMAPLDRIGRLRAIPLLAGFRLTTISFLAEVAVPQKLKPNTNIIHTDEPAEAVYVLDQGQVRLKQVDRQPMYLGNGTVFGFPSSESHTLMDVGLYKEHAQTLFESKVLAIDPRHLSEITGVDLRALAGRADRQLQQIQQTVAQQPLFAKLSVEEKRKLCGYVSYNFYPVPQELLKQGEVSRLFFLLMPHSAAMVGARGESAQRVEGPVGFNQQGLRSANPSATTVTAQESSEWLTLHQKDLAVFEIVEGSDIVRKLPLPRTVEYVPLRTRLLGIRPGQMQRQEILINLYKRHWLILLQKTFLAYILGAFVALLIFGLRGITQGSLPWWVDLLMLLGVFFVWLWGYINYLNDFLILTNQRVLRQEMTVLNQIRSYSAPLENIQNVDVSLDLAGKILGFGNIFIRTASSDGNIWFDNVTDPTRIKRRIFIQKELREQFFQSNTQAIIQASLEESAHAAIHTRDRIVDQSPYDLKSESGLQGFWEGLRQRTEKVGKQDWTQRELIVWRKHWFILLKQILVPLLILLLLLIMITGGFFLGIANGQDNGDPSWPVELLTSSAFLLAIAIAGLALAVWFIWKIADWRNDTYEIDYKQIVDVEKLPLGFSEQRRTAELGQIQDIEVNLPSPINTILGFGDVFIQTAASEGRLTFKGVGRPRLVANEIRRRMTLYRDSQEENRASQRVKEVQEWFDVQRRLEEEHEAISSG